MTKKIDITLTQEQAKDIYSFLSRKIGEAYDCEWNACMKMLEQIKEAKQ